jgi:glyoxylase-like metal-dependent hydrolase (beta-lactamase superfamily II)
MRLILTAALAAAAVFAQQAPAPLTTEKLAEGVYVLKGGAGANTGCVVAGREVIAIDAKMTREGAAAMLAEIARVAPGPVTRILLTHSDGDHVNGLPGFPAGIPIIAHPNAKKDMEEAAADPRQSELKSRLPSQTVEDYWMLSNGGRRVEFRYYGPAHTSGDMVVFVPDARIAFVGDLAFVGRDPLIHRQKGGNSFGAVKVLKALLELPADKYVSGHADPLDKEGLKGVIASLEEKQAKVKALVDQGKGLDDVRKAFNIPDPGAQPPRFRPFAEIVYMELTEKK